MKTYFEQIEEYLSNRLKGEALAAFEQAMTQDPKLKKAVENFPVVVEMLEVLEEQDMREYMQSLEPLKPIARRIFMRKWYRVVSAAMILVLVICGYANLKYSDQKLAEKAYYWPEAFSGERSSGEMGSEIEIVLAKVSQLENTKDYTEAIDLLNQKIPNYGKDPDIKLQKALALLHFKSGSFQESLNILEKLFNQDESFVRYNRSLNYIKLGDESRAKAELQELVDQEPYPKAEDLLKKLKSPWRKLVF